MTEEEAVFRSHIDGRLLALSPERAVAIQEALGSDVAMVLDHVVGLPNAPEVVRDAAERTVRWAAALPRRRHGGRDQALFAIVQGGLDPELRVACARQLRELDFAGYAIGGLSVGEEPAEMYRMLDVDRARTAGRPAALPDGRGPAGGPAGSHPPRHRSVRLRHADPQRPQRHGLHRRGPAAAAERCNTSGTSARSRAGCPCAACRRSRGYIRHLFMAGEMLGPILLSIHNLTYYQRLLADARAAIEADRFEEFRLEKLRGWAKVQPDA